MDAHGLICALKELAIELGRTPTRREFEAQVSGGAYRLNKLFSGYVALVAAAGLEPTQPKKKRKLTSEIFERDIKEVLDAYEPKPQDQKIRYTPTLIIPDTHFPFANKRVLEACYRFAEAYKPKRIVQLGDLFDLYSYSKFPRSLNLYSPQQEEELAVKEARIFWQELQKAAPEAECIQLKGNHDIRPLRRTLESLPALEHVVAQYFDKLMEFPNVKLIADPRQEYEADSVLYIHGHYSGIGKHRDFALMNIVCGHIHTGGVMFKNIRGSVLWELNAGLAGDPESKALSYTPQRTTHWTPGFGFIDEYGPRFIPV